VCLTDAVSTYLRDRNGAIVTLLYDASLRASEVCALDVDHLNLAARTVCPLSRIQKGSPPPVTLELAPSRKVDILYGVVDGVTLERLGRCVALLFDRREVGGRRRSPVGVRYVPLVDEPSYRVSPAYLFTLELAVLLERLETV
jgi:integrase